MKTLRFVLAAFVMLAVAGVQPADAQFGGLGKKLKKKVQDKVENTVERKVEDRVDRAMDRAIGETVDGVANSLESSVQGLLFSNEPAKIELPENETGEPDAPFVTYTMVGRVKLLGGASGMGMMEGMMNRFGATKKTTRTHAGFQREDDETSSEIRDAEGKRIIHIDHEEKTYSIMNLDELMEPMEKLTEQGMPSMEAPGMEMSGDAIRESKVTVDRREGVHMMNGAPCRRTVTVVETPTQMSAVDRETGETVTAESVSYMVLDQWHSTEVSGYNTLRAFDRKMAEAIMSSVDMEAVKDFAEAMKSSVPGAQDAMIEAYKEIGDIEGMLMRESIHFISASPDQTLDLDAVLEESATEPTAIDPSKPRPMYTFLTEIGGVTSEPIDMSVFSPPADYEQVESPMKRAMEMMEGGQ